ncbi:hypothetical protein [Jannaschia sp. 2305UL9-9]|uniref:hypothetical protein n=1 Tax=Jannaschia sp. 2305UL9-9 TaxID=3121638 RepID=UPI003528F615
MKKSKSPPAPKTAALTAEQVASRNASALARVADMDEPDKLRNLMANADRMGVLPVRDAAFRRLALVQTDAALDVRAEAAEEIEHDFTQTIFAYEQLVREELGKAKRLTKTRMAMTKSGAAKALTGFAAATAEYGAFATLMERGLSDMTGEAVILRHAAAFDEATRDAATARLTEAGIDPATLAA